jgi:hypothetical protein
MLRIPGVDEVHLLKQSGMQRRLGLMKSSQLSLGTMKSSRMGLPVTDEGQLIGLPKID